MKKITLSLATLVAVVSLHAGTDGVNTKLKHGADVKKSTSGVKSVNDLSSMFTEGKASGQVRAFYVDRKYQGGSGASTHRNSFALGGHLKFETAAYSGLSLGSAFYTTNDIGSGIGYGSGTKQDPSLLGTGKVSYSILGEAYVNYDMQNFGTKTAVKLGYQRYDTPMIGSDDARMLPNTFKAYKLSNNDFAGVNLQLAHVDAIAYGSFSNIYSGGILGATAGYAANGTTTGKYHNMGQVAVGKNTAGVTNLQAIYTATNFHVKVSNDYAWDLYNTLYADAGTSWNCLLNSNVHPFIQAQVIKQNSVGGKYMQHSTLAGNGDIDSIYWAAKAGAKYAGFSAYVAYSQTGTNNSSDTAYKNAIITQFGGMPAFTQGMVTRHQFLAGTKAAKIAAVYSFKEMGVNLSTAAYYASFDMDANSGYGVARTATEPGFDIQYYPAAVKKLQLRFRGNFPRKFVEATAGNDTGWNEYRLIANYNF